MNEVLRLFVNSFGRLPICFLGRCCRARPPVCFLMVFETVFFKACFGNFFLETTSTNSGHPVLKALSRYVLQSEEYSLEPVVKQRVLFPQLKPQIHFPFVYSGQKNEVRMSPDWRNRNPC